MVAIPPVLLVFDISALSTSSPSEWREFTRVGTCYIPQVIYEEMKMMFDRSPDPDLERIAKDFTRFHATSTWKVTEADAHHVALKMATGQSMTRRARVSLAVGRCAYALSQSFQTSIVVLVTKDRSLLQRLYEIPEVNLCGITGEALLQWSRSGQRPIAVIQKVQQFRTAHGLTIQATKERSAMPANAVRATQSAKEATFHSSPGMPAWLPDAISLVLTGVGLAIAGGLIWFMIQLAKTQNQEDPVVPTTPPSSQVLPAKDSGSRA
ncbi:MAG: hypothetical protein MUF49_07570 [Oculatellaceae cyanobacterium Prado106]|jgi:hypothetical protein|nr:hypothetical protein [Oculatellaceae cyanobacterium Prado106]